MKLFIAQTIDGFIAGPGGSLDHLNPFMANDYGYDAFIESVATVVIGRGTLDSIYPEHGWTYPPRLRGIVLTSRPLPDDIPDGVTAAADIDQILEVDRNAFVDGGGRTIRAMCERDLVREARIFTLPILLGDGVRLFPPGTPRTKAWPLEHSRTYPCGTVMHHYRVGAG